MTFSEDRCQHKPFVNIPRTIVLTPVASDTQPDAY